MASDHEQVFARFTAEGAHVPLIRLPEVELPPPAQLAASFTHALLHGIGRPEVREKADLR